MMRSLYSAISGLRNHQIRMDVVGNNIANVNTVGFKRSQVTFGTMLSQTMRGASSTDTATPPQYGGTNAIQIGLGVTLGAVTQVMSQGSSQYTGSDTDMMIQGDGFFYVKLNGKDYFTRAGAFILDAQGYLTDPATGALVQGYGVKADGTIDDTDIGNIQILKGSKITVNGVTLPDGSTANVEFALDSFSIDQSGVITGVYTNAEHGISTTRKIGQVVIATFANPAGLMSIGNNFYQATNNSGVREIGKPGEEGRGIIVPNSVEMSNVDLSQEFTDMIVTQRGFQANARVITVSDTLLQELVDLKR